MPRAYRPAGRRVIGGVSAGLSEHLGISVWIIRAAFIILTWINGVGLAAYVLLWWFLPLRQPESSPGIESATRGGRRTLAGPGAREVAIVSALLLIGGGVLLLIAGTGLLGNNRFLLPLAIAALGIALVWRQIDDRALASWMRTTSGAGFILRVAFGVGFVGLSAVWVLTQERGWSGLADLFGALVVTVVGLALLVGPWLSSLWVELGRERSERIRTQERADVAAHLHDSVLQTLALLQNQAHDPAAVRTLARRQERELRDWLFGDDSDGGSTLSAAIRAAAADVESTLRVAVDVVEVGDAAVDDDLKALVAAAREAIVNAAKHADVARVDVFVEVAGGTASVFVRDRGRGFEMAEVPADRQGVRGSIIDRVERHGGTATIRSAAGEGTEVQLTMPIRSAGEQS